MYTFFNYFTNIGFMLCYVSAMFAWLFFARLTMARIERQMRDAGIEWVNFDGPGFRVVSYAWAILFPVGRWNSLDSPFVDVASTRRFATKADWYRALWLWASLSGMLLLGFSASYFYGTD